MNMNPYQSPESFRTQAKNRAEVPSNIRKNVLAGWVGCLVYAALGLFAALQDLIFLVAVILSVAFAYGFYVFNRVSSLLFLAYVILGYIALTFLGSPGSAVFLNIILLVTGAYGCVGSFQYHKWVQKNET